jgi:hypothetical protein
LATLSCYSRKGSSQAIETTAQGRLYSAILRILNPDRLAEEAGFEESVDMLEAFT